MITDVHLETAVDTQIDESFEIITWPCLTTLNVTVMSDQTISISRTVPVAIATLTGYLGNSSKPGYPLRALSFTDK